MWTRRHFLSRSAGMLLGTASGAVLAFPEDRRETLPDGSAARGMITPAAENAIDAGLAYLARNRRRDGSFGTGAYQGNVAVTSLAALAFMAGGHLPGCGAYGNVVSDALQYVLAVGDRSGKPGYLHNPGGGTQHGPMYSHGFGTLFLAEISGMVHEPRLRDKLRDTLHKAVQLILDSQNKEGGWRYHPTPRDADISVTICQIMALRSARNAGLFIPKSQVDLCVAYVKRCQNPNDGSFRYQANSGWNQYNQAFARTAAGVCALYSAGIYQGAEVESGLNCLKDYRKRGQFQRADMHYFYGHYYAVQAMWTAGGEYWMEWFPFIREELIGRQRLDGAWLDPICTHYGTAMAGIIMQIPNNYLPILQK